MSAIMDNERQPLLPPLRRISTAQQSQYRRESTATQSRYRRESILERIVTAQQPQSPEEPIIAFDPEGDRDNPRDWPAVHQWGVTALLAFMAFTVTFTCLAVIPVASSVIADLSPTHEASKSSTVLLVTIWELGEAAGPLLIAPLSEVYGRSPIFNCANTLFIVGAALAAVSQTTGVLIFARFLTGCAVASNVLNPAVIGDIFPPAYRGSAMSAVMLAPLIGGAIGPAIAGAIAQSIGWRGIMYMSLILAIIAEILFLTLFRETFSPAILSRRAIRLLREKQTDDVLGSALERVLTRDQEKKASQSTVIWKAIQRPAKVLGSSIVLQMLCLYNAVVFSFFYIMSTTLPDILQNEYGFSPALTGSAFLTYSIGCLLAIILCNTTLDRIYIRLNDRLPVGTAAQPEARLPLSIIGAIFLPISTAMYGWTAQMHLHPAILLLIVILQGFSLIVAAVPVTAYVVDAFGTYSASSLTAVLISRCLMSTLLPLATAPLVTNLGWGWGFTVLAALVISLAPIPVLVLKFGAKWRQWSEYTREEELGSA